jgi:HD-like signal output (HDOD) protein
MRQRKESGSALQVAAVEALRAKVGDLQHLPTLPQAATRAMAVARNPASSASDLSAVIERDPALAAGVLRMANSALFRTGRPVETLSNAVARLGMRECQNLILAVGLRSLYRKAPPAQQRRGACLWQHSLLTACTCRRLNQALGLEYGGEEFACGLAHDLGRLLLGLAAPEHCESADPMTFLEGPTAILREREVLGTDHCALGAWFATRNDLPATLVSCIRFHHEPEKADVHPALVALVATADDASNYYQREGQFNGYRLAGSPAWSLLEPHLGGRQKSAEVAESVLAEAVKESQAV